MACPWISTCLTSSAGSEMVEQPGEPKFIKQKEMPQKQCAGVKEGLAFKESGGLIFYPPQRWSEQQKQAIAQQGSQRV